MAAREERWNLIQAKDGKVLRDDIGEALSPFDNDYDNIVASAYQGTLMAAREERWNLIQAKDGKVLRDDIGEALSLLTPNLYGFVRDGKSTTTTTISSPAPTRAP